ncbi:MAG: class I SAM-dependent rRNA methyltransferase [Planctomycetota bacterium]
MSTSLLRLPAPNPRRVALHVSAAALRSLRDGRPWVFRREVLSRSFDAAPGDVAVVFDDRERFAAVGLFDPLGEIAFRALAFEPTRIDAALLATRIARSIAARPTPDARTDAHRLVFGESDALPGLVVDRYADSLVLKPYTTAWVPWLSSTVATLLEQTGASRVVLRLPRLVAAQADALHGLTDGCALAGTLPDQAVVFRENGIRFRADVVRGQKTGFFLDQRDNRARVEALAAGRRVLNTFAYTGGFSLYAARGGATRVDSLDASAPALQEADANFALNRDDPRIAACTHAVLCGDAFDLLPDLAARGSRYDLVVLDPPAFAKRRSEVDGALRAYAKLTTLGLRLLGAGGVLVTCSCSARVDREAFFATVRGAAERERRRLREIATTGHPSDHPESEGLGYLKALFAEVEPPRGGA